MTTEEIDALLNPLRDTLARSGATPTLVVLEHVHGGWAIALEESFDDMAISRGYWPTSRVHELGISMTGVDD